MSYRELRNFIEIMRTLGYPRLISMDNFRVPNFPLVADILNWLVKRYDPNIQLPERNTEEQHLEFLKLAAQTMYTKARIKLNTKKLYSADGYAVKELLKICTILHDSMKPKLEQEPEPKVDDSNLSHKIQELKHTRVMSTEITQLGATIYELLGSEMELREARLKSVARSLDLDEIEKSIRQAILEVNEEINNLTRKQENLASDQVNLETKIEKKRGDLERHQNRLKQQQSVRPAFMDEYERMEKDLMKLHQVYLERLRNLEYLENELELYNRNEQEKHEESQKALRRLQRKMSNNNANDAEEEDEEESDPVPAARSSSVVVNNTRKPNKIAGSMQGGGETDSESVSGSDEPVSDGEEQVDEGKETYSDREF